MLEKEPPRWIQLPHGRAVFEHSHVGCNHLLLRVGILTQAIVPHRVVSDLMRISRPEQHLRVKLVTCPGETQKHQYDADVNNVATIPPTRTTDETHQGGKQVRAGDFTPHDCTPNKLLTDSPNHECTQCKTDA